MPQTALEINDLRKTYADLVAVDDISFSVAEGEIFGLLGPNGAGKTTAISIVNHIVNADNGRVAVFGHDIRTESRKTKKLCGIVPQELALYPTLSARANIAFFGSIYGLRGSVLRDRTVEALDMVGLADRADEVINNYSGGMKRRANMAAALVGRPKLLFLDEPTVGVDPQSRNHIFESIKRLNAEGMTIIYTSHYMEEVEALCGRVAIIDRGKLVAFDSTQNLIDSVGGGLLLIGSKDQPPGLLKDIESVDGVTKVVADDSQVKIEVNQAQKALPHVISMYNRDSIEILSLRVLEPNLETVFLNITGRELRD